MYLHGSVLLGLQNAHPCQGERSSGVKKVVFTQSSVLEVQVHRVVTSRHAAGAWPGCQTALRCWILKPVLP